MLVSDKSVSNLDDDEYDSVAGGGITICSFWAENGKGVPEINDCDSISTVCFCLCFCGVLLAWSSFGGGGGGDCSLLFVFDSDSSTLLHILNVDKLQVFLCSLKLFLFGMSI